MENKITCNTTKLGRCCIEYAVHVPSTTSQAEAVEKATAWARENRIYFQSVTVYDKHVTDKGITVYLMHDSGD
jgi:hypothetical protein